MSDSSSWCGAVTAFPSFAEKLRELTGRLPQFDLVEGAELRGTLQENSTEPSPTRALINVRAGHLGLANTGLRVLFPNKTWKQATTDALGEASIGQHQDDLPMAVFASAHGFAAHCERVWIPSDGALTIELESLHGDVQHVIFAEASPQIPGAERASDCDSRHP